MASEKLPSFANLPGQHIDSTARERRKELKQLVLSNEDMEALVTNDFTSERSEHAAESYALASFVIESLWSTIQAEVMERPLSPPTESVEGNTPAKRFVSAMGPQLDVFRDRFVDRIQASLASPEPLTKEQVLNVRYLLLKKSELGQLAVPSMRDLATLIGRMADVVPEVFMRDLGRQPTDDELSFALKHPSMKRMTMEMMTNSRPMLMMVLDRLEKDPSKDLDDPTGEFDASYFEIAQSDDQKLYVRFRPDIIQTLREAFERVAMKRIESRRESPRALACPALYTGRFVEMYDWMESEFEAYCRAASREQ